MPRSGNRGLAVVAALGIVFAAEQVTFAALDQIEVAQSAIRVFFPELTGKRYRMLVFWTDPFDKQWSTIGLLREFGLEVQESGADFLKGETKDTLGSGLLNAVCEFGASGDLSAISVRGRATHYVENAALRDLVDHHAEWSDAQVIDALKAAGARYGPNDETAFRDALPRMNALGFVFGAVPKITAVKFLIRDEVDPPAPRNANLYWAVDVEVASIQRPGTIRYVATFEPFAGKLGLLLRISK